MINLGEWGAIAGSITAIVSLILLVIRPIAASFSKITDRITIHEELKKHDERLDKHAEKLVEHTQQIKTLFRERRK